MLPGLFDAHVHLVSDAAPGSLERAGSLDADALDAIIDQSLRQQGAPGVTTVRDLGDVGYRTLAFRDSSRAGLPRIRAAGPPLTVPDGHCHYLGGAVDGPAIRAAVIEHEQRGVDVIKVMASGGMTTVGTDPFGVQFVPADLRTLVETAHSVGLPVLAHAHSLAGIRHALTAGVDGIEHFTGLDRDRDSCSGRGARGRRSGRSVREPNPRSRPRGSRLDASPAAWVAGRAEADRPRLRDCSGRPARGAPTSPSHGVHLVTGVDAGAAPTKRHGIVGLALAALTEGGFSIVDSVASATQWPRGPAAFLR